MKTLSKRKHEREHIALPKGLAKSAIPFLIVMAIPSIYGIIRYFIINGYSVLLAFSDGIPFQDPFTLRNFKMFLNEDKPMLFLALGNTLKYFIVGLIQQFICYVVAYFLYKKIPGHKLFRFILYMPCLIASVVSCTIFMELIREGGPVYQLTDMLFHFQYQDLLKFPATATKTMIAYLFLNGIGTTYLIYMGAMNRIPNEVLESGRLDGCNAWREFWSLIFPLTFNTYSMFFLMSLCGIFTASGPILYMTKGAANTTTLGYWLFQQIYDKSLLNYPAAIGVFFTLCGLPILAVARWLINKFSPEVTY